MLALNDIRKSVLHVLFPHVCAGCGNDTLNEESTLCMRCLSELPETRFHLHANNPLEKIFWGRLPLANGTAQYYFSKETRMQHLMHQFKYKGNKDLGRQLGCLMGIELVRTNRFKVEALIPLPLFPAKEKRRGYNQATVLCEGIGEIMKVDIFRDVIVRTQHTETQTKKGRVERWMNIEGKFELINPEKIQNKNILLVDDVITTGATLEACGQELLKATGVRLSLATLCFASH